MIRVTSKEIEALEMDVWNSVYAFAITSVPTVVFDSATMAVRSPRDCIILAAVDTANAALKNWRVQVAPWRVGMPAPVYEKDDEEEEDEADQT